MCLAKAYVRSDTGSSTTGPGDGGPGSGDIGSSLVMENVTQIEVHGDEIRLRSLFGTTESLRGRIASVDFAESKVILDRD